MKADQSVIGRVVLGLLVLSFVGVMAGSGHAQDAASFYKGKNMNFVVSVAPGGGYDTYARMISPYLEKETSSYVGVVNMPGGDGYVSLRYMYSEKPTGLNIILSSGTSSILKQLFKDPRAAGMDMSKFNYLCRLDAQPNVLLLSKKFPYKSLDDLKKAGHTITSGTSASMGNQHLSLSILAEAIGLDAKLIVGYGGSSQESLAAMRGETTVYFVSAGSAIQYAKQPELSPLCTVALKRSPLHPDLPCVAELVKLNPQQVKWFELLDNLIAIERPIFTTPGVPADRVKFLDGALGRILTNKEFLALAAKNERPISYLPSQQIQKIVNDLLNMPESEVEWLKRILDKHFMKSMTG